jgi:hypothetical protein
VHDHADRIADEQQVAVLVEDLGDGRRIGRQADDRRLTLAGGDVRRRQAADLFVTLG